MNQQELADMADVEYGKGYRDGKVEAILAILDLIDDHALEYAANEVRQYIDKLEMQARKRRDSYK